MTRLKIFVVTLAFIVVGGLLLFGFFPSSETLISGAFTKERTSFGSWSSTTTPWEARDAHALVTFKDKLFLLGGIDGNAIAEGDYVEYWKAPHFNDVWISSDGVSWERAVEHAAFSPRRSISVFPVGETLVMLGGWSPVDGYHTGIWTSLDGISWIRATSSPAFTPREGQIVRERNGEWFMFGGVNFDTHTLFNDVWISSDGVSWKELTGSAGWEPRYDHDVAVKNGAFILAGGLHFGGDGYADAWKSQDGISWEKILDNAPWGKRHGHLLFTISNTMYIVSGWNITEGRGNSDMWESQDGISWKQTMLLPFIGREDHAGEIFHDRMIVTGGMDSNWHWENDYWTLPIHAR